MPFTPYNPLPQGTAIATPPKSGSFQPFVPGQKPTSQVRTQTTTPEVAPTFGQTMQKEIAGPKRGLMGEILPTGGAIVGGIVGGIAGAAGGAALGLPEAGVGAIPGAAIGGYTGSVAGSALGGAAGEALQQEVEKVFGSRKELSGKEIGKTALSMGAAEAIGGPVASVAGKVVKGLGESLYKMAIPTSAKEAALLQTYKAGTGFLERVGNILKGGVSKAPTTAADTSLRKGLMGTESMLGIQAKRASTKLWKGLIEPQLNNSKVVVNVPRFLDEAKSKIIAETPELGRQSQLLKALKAVQDEYSHIGSVPLKELQKLKEGWAEFVPEKAYKGESIAGAYNDVRNILSGMSRTKIYDSLGAEVKQAYHDYGNLQGIKELGQKAMTGGKLKGGFGSFWSGIKDIAVTPVATIGGQVIYRTGQGIEFIGKEGGRTLRDVIFGASQDVGKDTTNGRIQQP